MRSPCCGWAHPVVARQWLRVRVMLQWMVSRRVCLGIKHPSGAYDQILILSDSCRFVDVGRSL
jgi:hypothetical protein